MNLVGWIFGFGFTLGGLGVLQVCIAWTKHGDQKTHYSNDKRYNEQKHENLP